MGGVDQPRLGHLGGHTPSQMRAGLISGSQNESRYGAATVTYRSALPELCLASLHRSSALQGDQQHLPTRYPGVRPNPSIDPNTDLWP
jgi:hypothetical protein